MSQFKPLPPIQELQQAFDYDPATGIFRNKYTRSSKAVKGAIAGCKSTKNYIYIQYNWRMLRANRLAWYLVTGNDPLDKKVDHADRNPFNNAFSNLRLATDLQNQGNRLAKGWRRTPKGRYKAVIKIGPDRVYLGTFDTKEEAHAVYKAKHIEIHGSFSPYFQ